MGIIKPVRTEADHEAALARIHALMGAEPGTPEGEELDALTDLVEHYEEKHVPLGIQAPSLPANSDQCKQEADSQLTLTHAPNRMHNFTIR